MCGSVHEDMRCFPNRAGGLQTAGLSRDRFFSRRLPIRGKVQGTCGQTLCRTGPGWVVLAAALVAALVAALMAARPSHPPSVALPQCPQMRAHGPFFLWVTLFTAHLHSLQLPHMPHTDHFYDLPSLFLFQKFFLTSLLLTQV